MWFTDQNSKPIELEDEINVTLVINYPVTCKKRQAIQLNIKTEYL